MNRKQRLLFLTIAILGGFIAGILGGWSESLLLPGGGGLNSNVAGELDLNTFNNPNLIIRDAKKIVVNQDLAIAGAINSASASLVRVFKKNAAESKDGARPSYYDFDKPLASGLILSADGWVVLNWPETEAAKSGFKKENAASFVVIGPDKKNYKVADVSYSKSQGQNWVFVLLAEASNLPVKKIVDSRSLRPGDSLLLLGNNGSVLSSSLVNKGNNKKIASSDYDNSRLLLAASLSDDFKNSFVFNLGGDLIAWVNGQKEVIPAQIINLNWQNLAKNKIIKSPYLGLYYLDLNRAQADKVATDYGALIYPNENGVSIIKDSPADKAGLRSGDLILQVENQELKGDVNLAQALAAYSAGDTVTLLYVRGQEKAELDIKLGELK